ncbi:MAG TPA: HEAT repeat domain-containing protein [Verrucomicrobiae bacterium]|nr:HEAT repeat domain-containing protein [Verrucomicrobiae bacterium]
MKRALLLLVVIGIAGIIGLTLFRRNSEPTYKGRTVHSWLNDYGSSPIGGGLAHARFGKERRLAGDRWPGEAIRALGTNAIGPLLAELNCPDDPPWANATKRFLTRLPLLKLQFRDAPSRRERAAVAFFDLGDSGLTAIPELSQLLTNYSTAVYAAHALAGMGTNAIPAFTAALANSNTWVMDCGAWGLAQIGPDSREAVPQILLQLPRGNPADQMLMLWALGEVREPANLIIAELTSRLRDSDPQVRQFAANTLRKFGSEARLAAAEIKTALTNETNLDTRAALEQLSRSIKSEAETPLDSAR